MKGRRFAGDRPEAGETLIEVLASTLLMGLVVVGMIGALASTVLGSHVHRQQADGNAILVSAMERIKSFDLDFSNVDCAKTDTQRRLAYEAQANEVPLPSTWPASPPTPYFAVSNILFENAALVAGTPTVTFTTSCFTGLRRQLLTLTLTSPDGRAAPALSFVKGDI